MKTTLPDCRPDIALSGIPASCGRLNEPTWNQDGSVFQSNDLSLTSLTPLTDDFPFPQESSGTDFNNDYQIQELQPLGQQDSPYVTEPSFPFTEADLAALCGENGHQLYPPASDATIAPTSQTISVSDYADFIEEMLNLGNISDDILGDDQLKLEIAQNFSIATAQSQVEQNLGCPSQNEIDVLFEAMNASGVSSSLLSVQEEQRWTPGPSPISPCYATSASPGTPGESGQDDNLPSDKKLRKQIQNKEAARRYRAKKKREHAEDVKRLKTEKAVNKQYKKELERTLIKLEGAKMMHLSSFQTGSPTVSFSAVNYF